MNPNYSDALKKYLELEELFAEKCELFGFDSQEVDDVRDLMDVPWDQLTQEETDNLRKNGIYPEYTEAMKRIDVVIEREDDERVEGLKKILIGNYTVKSLEKGTDWETRNHVTVKLEDIHYSNEVLEICKKFYQHFNYTVTT